MRNRASNSWMLATLCVCTFATMPILTWSTAGTTDPNSDHRTSAESASKRKYLHAILDRAKNQDDYIHNACGELRYFGDSSSVPHLIRVLQFFGDAELPLPPGVGIVCTQQHCVDTLEQLTGVKVGISYSSWKHWWEETHPGEPLAGPPNKRVSPSAGAEPPR